MITKSSKFRCWHNLTGEYDLAFEGNSLFVNISMPYRFKLISIVDDSQKEVYSKYYLSKECKCKLALPSGKYYIFIYVSNNGFYYDSYIGGKQIKIERDKENNWCFILPEYYEWNRNLIKNKLLNYVQANTLLDNKHTMRRVAARLIAGRESLRDKVLAIHDFVAKNVYYDYDSLLSKVDIYRTIEQIAQTKRCVCQGYADFALVLLHCAGIEAENILCYTVEYIFEHGWSETVNRTSELNHIITRVKLENRWLYMDVTWDSNNRYENGQYIKGKSISHRYFDVTLPFLSATHRFFKKK